MSSDTPLDDAWKAAEAALPEGAYVTNLGSFTVDTRTGAPFEWVATATRETRTWASSIDGRGKTPAAALLALAEKLTRA